MAHLVWDWNGTLLDDFGLVVEATNISLATVGGAAVTAEEHRRMFRRPVIDYYAVTLGRPVDAAEFERLDKAFHDAYRLGLPSCALTPDALDAIRAWSGTQSLLSMWSHAELVPEVARRGLGDLMIRVDGRTGYVLGDLKAAYLRQHLEELGVSGRECVLVGDSVDDADAADAVGARCVLYTGGFTGGSRLRGTGHPVAATLVEAVAIAGRIVGDARTAGRTAQERR